MIRRAKTSDRKEVEALWLELLRCQAEIDDRFTPADDALERWRNDFRAWTESESRRMFVAVVDGAVRGFVTAERWFPPPVYAECPGVYIDELYVEADFRRRGVATELVDAVRHWAESVGARQIRAGALAGNEAGRAFWSAVAGSEIVRTYALSLEVEESSKGSKAGLGFRM